MIAYLDSSVLARAYLADEDGHEHAVALLGDSEIAPVTGTWTRIEVSRAMDSWHLAVASLTIPALAEPGEEIAFASRDEAQATIAELLGFTRI